ncbi:MAG: hypothetical protein PHC31_13050 [Clostridia bacterium]|nr:hypothetical protein [Clostridia bacterium]
MYQLICTSYTETEQGLVLRNNWIEAVFDDKYMLDLIEKWQLPNDFKYPAKGSISSILHGKMDIDKVVIHVRIVRF